MKYKKAFYKVVTEAPVKSNASTLVIASFAFITNFIAKPYLDDYVNSLPIYHLFVNSESDHLPTIISNLPQIDSQWFLSLLEYFVRDFKKTHNSKIMLPILKIIERDPNTMILPVLSSGEISLISYVLSSINKPLDPKIDLLTVATSALNGLATAKNSEVDDCLVILSYHHPSFNLKLELNSDNTELKLILSDKESTTLLINNYKNIPSFYLLQLPITILTPKEEDSLQILTSKFKTLSYEINNSILDVNETIELFDEITQYDNDKSNLKLLCIKCISEIINTLLTNAKDHKIISIIRRILFETKFVSWVHCMNILKVIEKIEFNLSDYISNHEIIHLLLKFMMNKNEKLSFSSMKLIVTLSEKNFYLVTNIVSHNIDFFSNKSVQKHLKLLAMILKNNNFSNSKTHLTWIIQLITENKQEYIYDLKTISYIFDFLQYFNYEKTCFKKIAFSILALSVNYLKGIDCTKKVYQKYSYFDNAVIEYMNLKSYEIISKNVFKFENQYPLLRNAYNFLMEQKLSRARFYFLVDTFYEFFPSKSIQKIIEFRDQKLMQRIINKINIITDSHLIALIIRKIDNEQFETFANYYLNHPNQVDTDDLLVFANYLNKFGTKYENNISQFLNQMKDINETKTDKKDKIILSNNLAVKRNNDDLNDMFNYSYNISSIKSQKFYLLLSAIHRFKITINENYNLSIKIIKFITKHNIKLNNSNQILKDYILNIINKRQIRKKDLMKLSKLIPLINDDIPELYKFISEQFNDPKHYQIKIILTSLLVLRSKDIPNEFVDSIFNVIKTNTNELSIRETSFCLVFLSEKIKFNEQQNSIMRSLFSFCGLLTTEISLLYSIIISQAQSSNSKFVIGNLNHQISMFFDSEIPSYYCNGIRLLRKCLSSMNSKQFTKIIEPSFELIIEKALFHKSIYQVNKITAMFLNSILQRDLPKLHYEINKNITDLIPSSRLYILLIPQLLRINVDNDEFFIKLSNAADSILNEKQFDLIQIYFDSILTSIENVENRRASSLRCTPLFIESIRGYDSYNMNVIIEKWLTFMKKNVNDEEILKIMCQNMMNNFRRFFPFFHEFAKEFLKCKEKNESFCDDIIKLAIENQKDETHKCALELLSANNVAEALDIALLEPKFI